MVRNRAIVWALLLIGIGVFLLLRNTGAIPEDVEGWPLLLLGIGVWLLLEHLWFRNGGFVWPLVLIVVGVALFLQNLDALRNEDLVIPIVVIAIGAGLMLSALLGRGAEEESLAVPLDGASEASVRIEHGAGRLQLASMLGGEQLLEGRCVGGVQTTIRRTGGRLDVTLRSRAGGWPHAVGRSEGMSWNLSVNRQVPLSLALKTGASDTDLDLTDLRVTDLEISAGASRTGVTLPTSGRCSVRIEAGAANLRVRVPTNVAARIESHGGLASVDVDERRFPRSGDEWRSPDYDAAERRADIRFDVGAASVRVE